MLVSLVQPSNADMFRNIVLRNAVFLHFRETMMNNGRWANEEIMDGTYRHPISEKQIEANKKMNDFFE